MKHKASYACLALLVLAAAAPVRAETKTLRVTLQPPASSHLGENVLEFGKEVETRTAGTVAIKLFDKAQLYDDHQAPQAVATGAVEMAVAGLGQFAAAVPAVGIFQQPFVFNFDQVVWAAAKRGSELRTLVDEEVLRKMGSRVLWWQPSGLSVVLSRSKPVMNPQALEGLTMRVFDASTQELVKVCGGKAQLVSSPTLYDALEKGISDAVLTGITSVSDHKLWGVARALIKLQHAPLLSLVVINQKVWQSLTVEQQHILTEAANSAEELVWDRLAVIEGDAYVLAIQKGLAIHELSRDDLKAWRLCSSSVLESFVERSGEVGAQLFAAYGRLRTQPCCNPAFGTLSLGRW